MTTAERESMRLLFQLHQLMAAGQGDTDAAQDLSDQMQPHWKVMTGEEQERLRYLSELLYTLHPD